MPWSGKLAEKPVVTDLVKKFYSFMGPQGSFPFSQESVTGFVLNQIIPVHFTRCFFKLSNIILLSGFKPPSGLFPSVGHLST